MRAFQASVQFAHGKERLAKLAELGFIDIEHGDVERKSSSPFFSIHIT